MSSDVLFVLFDASNVGLFQECSSLLKRIFIFFIDKNRSDFFKRFSINLNFFLLKNKSDIYIYIYICFTYNSKTNFLLCSKKPLFYLIKQIWFFFTQNYLFTYTKTDMIFLWIKSNFFFFIFFLSTKDRFDLFF